MAYTRPSGLPIIDDHAAKVIEEVAHVDERGRINFLPRWRDRIAWLSRSSGNVEALMIFKEPGLIAICNWLPDGPNIQKRYEELAERSDSEALEALRLIQSRFRRLSIPANDRTSMGDAALVHLGLPFERDKRSSIYVSILPDRIELLSPDLRNSRLLLGSILIDDLP
ncbi:hypothetical protein EOW77_0028800 [Bradyrhizobium yuanmingense]|uniref:hypothetical protein n=1 Tax=Bradyrhizobium yuanmingense TaxID=108015 RepID=UPI000FE3638A|nr:hypothetical protein [Bradyrhizobium yuanmingense]TGN78921.1 hypothetical protein EOW77_0028800 [Bradyrhizobium yuanmingense]